MVTEIKDHAKNFPNGPRIYVLWQTVKNHLKCCRLCDIPAGSLLSAMTGIHFNLELPTCIYLILVKSVKTEVSYSNIGFKYGLSCIDVHQVLTEIFKTKGKAQGLKLLIRYFANVNVLIAVNASFNKIIVKICKKYETMFCHHFTVNMFPGPIVILEQFTDQQT